MGNEMKVELMKASEARSRLGVYIKGREEDASAFIDANICQIIKVVNKAIRTAAATGEVSVSVAYIISSFLGQKRMSPYPELAKALKDRIKQLAEEAGYRIEDNFTMKIYWD